MALIHANHSPAHTQRGQILVGVLAASVILIVSLVTLFNVGRHSTEKTVVVNAADAVAFSGATQYARNLNFIAYTNRAMMATNIGVTHALSYMSWIRYLADVQRAINDGETLPPEYATLLATMTIDDVRLFAEADMQILSTWSAFAQEGYQAIQSGFDQTLEFQEIGNSVQRAMERVACRYEPNFNPSYYSDLRCERFPATAKLKVNDSDTLARMLNYTAALGETASYNKLLQAEWGPQLSALVNFTEQKIPDAGTTGNLDGGRMYALVSESTNAVAASNWIFNRDWTSGAYTKIGSATTTPDIGEITSADSIQSGGVTIASGAVSSNEYAAFRFFVYNPVTMIWTLVPPHTGYVGIENYRHLPDAPSGLGPIDDSVTITAFVSIELEDRPMTFRPYIDEPILPDGSAVFSAVSQARVFYQRPLGNGSIGFAPLANASVEYANLYNPFWHAKLVN